MRDYDKYSIKRKYIFKEEQIGDIKVKVRQRFDEHGGYFYRVETKSVVKVEGTKPTAVVVECAYQEGKESWIDYMGEVCKSNSNIRSHIQIRLLGRKSKTCKTFQIYGTEGFRDKGVIQISNTGRTGYIDIAGNWEFSQILNFIQYNFDDFTKEFVNLNLQAIEGNEITSTPKCILQIMEQTKEVDNFDKNEEYFYT